MNISRLALLTLVTTSCASRGPRAEPDAARVRPRADALISTYRGRGVTPIPDSVRQRFNLDTTFYARFATAGGIPVIASARVPDEALLACT